MRELKQQVTRAVNSNPRVHTPVKTIAPVKAEEQVIVPVQEPIPEPVETVKEAPSITKKQKYQNKVITPSGSSKNE